MHPECQDTRYEELKETLDVQFDKLSEENSLCQALLQFLASTSIFWYFDKNIQIRPKEDLKKIQDHKDCQSLQKHDTIEGVIANVYQLIEYFLLNDTVLVEIELQHILALPIKECLQQVEADHGHHCLQHDHDVCWHDKLVHCQVYYYLQCTHSNKHLEYGSLAVGQEVQRYGENEQSQWELVDLLRRLFETFVEGIVFHLLGNFRRNPPKLSVHLLPSDVGREETQGCGAREIYHQLVLLFVGRYENGLWKIQLEFQQLILELCSVPREIEIFLLLAVSLRRKWIDKHVENCAIDPGYVHSLGVHCLIETYHEFTQLIYGGDSPGEVLRDIYLFLSHHLFFSSRHILLKLLID